MNERATIVRTPAIYQDVLDAPPKVEHEVRVAPFEEIGFPLSNRWP